MDGQTKTLAMISEGYIHAQVDADKGTNTHANKVLEQYKLTHQPHVDARVLGWTDKNMVDAIIATAFHVKKNGFGGCSVASGVGATWGKEWLEDYKKSQHA